MIAEGPLAGWRIWRYHEGRLRSWFVDYVWEPGTLEAECLLDRLGCPPAPASAPCSDPPGEGCKCGFWAVWDLGSCLRKARRESSAAVGTPVVGVMGGWGTAAIHGSEGFRSRYASVMCLLSDNVWSPRLDRVAGRLPRLITNWNRWFGGAQADLPATATRALSSRYGIPVLTMRDALAKGVIGEFGLAGAETMFPRGDRHREK